MQHTIKVLFVTTYDPASESLGGASWVDKQIVKQLENGISVELVTVADPSSTDDVPLEVRNSRGASIRTLVRMLIHKEPYQQAKFRWHKNWQRKLAAIVAKVESADIVITSQWPALLLLGEAGIRPDIHIAHNIDWILANKFDPAIFKSMGNNKRMKKLERALLGLPKELLALSTSDVQRLAEEGIFAEHLPLFETNQVVHTTVNRKIGFIGKMSWPPNLEAVNRLLDEVLPRINASLSEPIEVVLAGRGSKSFVDRKNVLALGTVDSLSDFYDQVDIVAVPRLGEVTGISVKMVEALQKGKPVVAPRQLALDAGSENARVLIADSTDEMTRAIIDYYQKPPLTSYSESPARPMNSSETNLLRSLVTELSVVSKTRSLIKLNEIQEFALPRCVKNLDELIEAAFCGPKTARVQTVNLHHAYLAKSFHDFRVSILEADFVTADGWPIVNYINSILPKTENIVRVTGSDFLRRMLDDPRIRGKRVGLIGGTSDAASALKRLLETKGSILAYSETGQKSTWLASDIALQLNEASCDYVFLAVTPPFGDLFARELILSGATGFIAGIGGGLDMLVGAKRRAPRAVQLVGAEWLFRLIQDPRHLWRRYVVECMPTYIQMRFRLGCFKQINNSEVRI